jgi:hypothetical protein
MTGVILGSSLGGRYWPNLARLVVRWKEGLVSRRESISRRLYALASLSKNHMIVTSIKNLTF